MSEREWTIKKITTFKELKKFLEENDGDLDDNDWVAVKGNPALDNSLIKEYAGSLPMNTLSSDRELPLDIIEENEDSIDWHTVSMFYHLTEKFIQKHKDQLSLNKCLKNEFLSKNALALVTKLFKQKDNPEHHKIWDENIQKSKMFRVSPPNPQYSDYQKKETKQHKVHSKKNVPANLDFSKMSRTELKNYLESKNIRVYYHDTISILIEKCKNIKS